MFRQFLIWLTGYKYAISLCGHTKLLATYPYTSDYVSLLFTCDHLLADCDDVGVDFDVVHENINKCIYTDFTFTRLT